MSTIAVLQARMGSTRFPGKAMADLLGKPLLTRVVERACAIQGIKSVVVATTSAEHDHPLLELAQRCGVHAFAGSEEDVLDRYYRAARAFDAEVIVRLTGDCPLLDPDVSQRVLMRFQQGDVDYASNTVPPTFPDGLDTEVFSLATLERAWREASLTSEREHVTPYIWKNPDKFRLANVTNPVDLSALRWTVDEPQDLQFVCSIYDCLGARPVFGMADVLALLAKHPSLEDINSSFERNQGYQKSLWEDSLVGKDAK